jgi:RNA polymerase sigma-70 factor (ECF subfamily)
MGDRSPFLGGEITQLLRRLRAGDGAAADELMPAVYAELRRIAARHLRRERRDHTLSPTALVNEAYVKLFEHRTPDLADRAHFMALATRVMRSILVDYSRARGSAKRGGDSPRVPFEPNLDAVVDGADFRPQLLDLDRAIDTLARENPSLAQVIEMRYFGGMTAEETSEVVGRSVHIVRHELRLAQAWLRRELAGAATGEA